MIGFMSLEQQVDVHFGRARRRGLVGRLVDRVRGKPRALLAFDEARKASAGGAPVPTTESATDGGWSRCLG